MVQLRHDEGKTSREFNSEDPVAVPRLLRTHAALDGLEHALLSMGFHPRAFENLHFDLARNHDDAVQVAENGIAGADVDAADPAGQRKSTTVPRVR